jgi:hypothetical protein
MRRSTSTRNSPPIAAVADDVPRVDLEGIVRVNLVEFYGFSE